MADPSTLAASSTTMWAFIASWFTPSSLFLLLNVMIGTVFISSRFHSSPFSSKHPTHQQQPGQTYHQQPGQRALTDTPPLARAPSLLDRVRSINFFAHKFEHHPDCHYPDSAEFSTRIDPPLAHAPSLLQLLKSISFTPYIFDHPTTIPEPEFAPPVDLPPLGRAPSLLQRLKSINILPYRYNHPNPIPEHDTDPVYSEPARTRTSFTEPPPLAPAPSFLERVKSINFSLYEQDEPDPAGHMDHTNHHVKTVTSDTRPTGGKASTRLPGKMRKSASDKSAFGHFRPEEDEDVADLRRPETAREQGRKKGRMAAVEEAEEIDKKADDFINRFKQQLKLQRLDSIMRYKEILSRGSAS